MKIVFRTLLFHILCIIAFATAYSYLHEDFNLMEENRKNYVDFLFLSTAIQTGVGISDFNHFSYYIKIVMITQQILLLLTHVITLYVFTL